MRIALEKTFREINITIAISQSHLLLEGICGSFTKTIEVKPITYSSLSGHLSSTFVNSETR